MRSTVSSHARVLALAALASACGNQSQGPADARPPTPDGGADGPADARRDGPVTDADARVGTNSDAATHDAPDGADAPAWRPLIDDADLSSWNRYLGKPSAAEAPLGLDDDPRGVFSIVTIEGAPALRVSGEIWGALISKETFCDFHLRAQYKWGTQVWPPLNTRDSGLMYLSTGPLGAVNAGGPSLSDPAGSGAFMASIEYQIAPSDVGDLVALGPIAFTSLGRLVPAERADWNDVDIVVRGGVATHTFNGVVVASAQGFILDWPGQPASALGCGKLQLQSEGDRNFFRGVEVQTPP